MPLARDLHGDDGTDGENESVDMIFDKDEPNWHPPWGVAMVVLLVELCERLCYYTLKGTMRQWLQQVGNLKAPQASAMSASASTLCYLWAVPGGWLADTIGRYKVIVSFSVVYVIGTVMVAYASTAPEIETPTNRSRFFVMPPDGSASSGTPSFPLSDMPTERRLNQTGLDDVTNPNQAMLNLYLIGFMGLIAMGTGSIKPNVNSFGADQFLGGGEKGKQCQESFFTYFYQSINVGSFISFVFLVGLVDTKGYYVPYAISAGCMFFAVCSFMAATPCYKHAPVGKIGGTETMAIIGRHIFYGLRGPFAYKWRAVVSLIGWFLIPLFLTNSLGGAFVDKESELHDTINRNAIVLGGLCIACLTAAHIDNSWIQPMPDNYCMFCDKCWFYGCSCCLVKGRQSDSSDEEDDSAVESAVVDKIEPEEIRAALGIVPLVVCIQTCFHLCYNSMEEAFPLQACQMDCRYPWNSDKLFNGAQLNLFNSAGIILGAPLLETFFFPMGARFTRRKECRLGMKIVAGLVVVSASNVAAALQEIKRRTSPSIGVLTECGVPGTEMRDISALWIAVPMILVGIGELMVNAQLYAFVYMSAPPRMRSTAAAFNLLAGGCLSHALTSPLQAALFPENLDEGRLENYYFVNALMGLFGIVLYFLVTHFPCGRDVRPKSLRDDELEWDAHQEAMAEAASMKETLTMR